jgi:hypothetical protein
LERAVVVGALVAAALIFLLRGWSGYYPSKLSTTGAEYPDRTAEHVARSAREAVSAVEDHKDERRRLDDELATRLDALEARMLEIG